jgi:hypothetical protein
MHTNLEQKDMPSLQKDLFDLTKNTRSSSPSYSPPPLWKICPIKFYKTLAGADLFLLMLTVAKQF